MNITDKLLPTTVVGSYPAVESKGFMSILDPYKGALETAVADQIRAGIDIISTGQVRGDMISTILSKLPGIAGHEVTGMIKPSPGPITAADTKYAVSRHSTVKAMFAGPSTLAHALKIATPMYRNREEVVADLAQALVHEAGFLREAGACIIQMDEPILSTGIASMDAAKSAIELIAESTGVTTCLHVCGDVGEIIDELLEMPVDILDLEFANNPGNVEAISGVGTGGKMIGYGVVDSADGTVDSVETIRKRIEKAIDIIGPERLLIDPDCGLRMHDRETAFGKLRNMAEAAESLRREL